jgi:DNA polymerase-3 subunit epsilon
VGLSFVSIDFETANSFRGSPCAIGMIKVINGQITEDYSALIRPPKGYDDFDPWNTTIHGITPTHVRNSKRFGDQWPDMLKFIGDLPIVAHNAGFDMGVMREALRVSDISWPQLNYACTMVMSRRIYEIPSHTLAFVAEAAEVPWDEELHHDAKYDALIAAQITISMARKNECDTLEELLNKLKVAIGKLTPERWVGCQSQFKSRGNYASHSHSVNEAEINTDADASHPIYGKKIVFTGALHSMARIDAWKAVAFLGGVPQDSGQM